MANDELQKRLAELKAKRKPALSEAEAKVKAAEAALLAEIEAEQRALREEENEAIAAKFAPTKARRFFDFDPECIHPATVVHNGAVCELYTRFVVRGANADQLERNNDVYTFKGMKNGEPDVVIDTAKAMAVTIECAEQCIVYPTADTFGVTQEQHIKNVKASLWYLGAARAEVGKAAIELGGTEAALRRSKS